MERFGPIIIMEDDPDDQEFIKNAIRAIDVTNEIKFFKNGEEGLNYLRTTDEQPFMIISDVIMPGIDGIEFKRRIDLDLELRNKCIPFVFFTSAVNKIAVKIAFSKTATQGFFEKPTTYKDFTSTVQIILDYWKVCKRPY